MPIASTSPNSVSMLMLNPSASITAKVPTSETGHGGQRNDGRAPRLQEEDDHDDDEHDGFKEGDDDRLDGAADEDSRIVNDRVIESFREVLLELVHRGADVRGQLQRIGAG